MTNAPDDLGPSLPRELFNENGEAFGAELETLLDSFEQLDNVNRPGNSGGSDLRWVLLPFCLLKLLEAVRIGTLLSPSKQSTELTVV